MARTKDLEAADVCLARAQTVHPKNRDLSFQRTRVRAWSGDHRRARADLEAWAPLDREGHELDGDLHWYAGEYAAAARAYGLATKSKGKSAPSIELKDKLDRALRASETARAPGLVVLEMHRYQQAADLTANEARASLFYERSRWLGRVEVLSLTRSLGDATTQDATIAATAGRYWGARQLFELSLGTSVDEPESVYRRMASARHEGFVADGVYLGAELRVSQHESETASLGTANAGLYRGNAHGLVKLFRSKAGSALLLRAQYGWQSFTPELWGAAGRAEAVRPHLLGSGERTTDFKAIGTKLAWSEPQGFGLFIDAEWRTDETALQRMFGGGATWSF